MRAAASEEQAAALMRDTVNERLLLPLILRLGSDQPELRACLIASQIVGLTTATHIIRLEPLTYAPAELLATALTPVFEHYLSGTLSVAGVPVSSADRVPGDEHLGLEGHQALPTGHSALRPPRCGI